MDPEQQDLRKAIDWVPVKLQQTIVSLPQQYVCDNDLENEVYKNRQHLMK